MTYTPITAFADVFTRLNVTTSHQELLWFLPVLYLGVSKDGTIKYVNHKWLEDLGYTPEEMHDKNFMDFVVSDVSATDNEFKEVQSNKGYDSLFINHYRCKNGDVVEIEWSSRYIHSTLMSWGVGTVRKRIPKEEGNNG